MEEGQEPVRNRIIRNTVSHLTSWISAHQPNLSLLAVALVVTLISCSYYLAKMLAWTEPGFPLDDTWIHLQYAKTIHEGRPWEYSPGQPSTGSTSPLWSIVLSVLFLFTEEPTVIVWGTILLTTTFYVVSTFLVGKIASEYVKNPVWGVLAMIGFVIVPGNTWLMLSGMETSLFMTLLLLAVLLLERREMKYDLAIAVVVGLAVLARPEAVVIVLVCIPARILILVWNGEVTRRRVYSFLLMGIIIAAVVLPWILHCMSVSGHPLPDTFYAKYQPPSQSDIESWNIWWNFWLMQWPFLLVAFVGGLVLVAKGRPHLWLLAIALTVLYRFTMPLIALLANHRYLIPVHCLFFVVAAISVGFIIEAVLENRQYLDAPGTIRLLAAILVIGVLLAPMIPGYCAQAEKFGNATKNINDMQVAIGEWVYHNTPDDAVLALCDIGAIRFFSNRSIIDLIGLVTPDILYGNFTRLETLHYLKNHSCDYMVIWTDWFWAYEVYVAGAWENLFTVSLTDNIICGRDAMSVYHINWSLTSFG